MKHKNISYETRNIPGYNPPQSKKKDGKPGQYPHLQPFMKNKEEKK
jgi:hypothetical protein